MTSCTLQNRSTDRVCELHVNHPGNKLSVWLQLLRKPGTDRACDLLRVCKPGTHRVCDLTTRSDNWHTSGVYRISCTFANLTRMGCLPVTASLNTCVEVLLNEETELVDLCSVRHAMALIRGVGFLRHIALLVVGAERP